MSRSTARGFTISLPLPAPESWTNEMADRLDEHATEAMNRGAADRVVEKLRCRTRGCKEIVLHVGIDPDGHPAVSVMAPMGDTEEDVARAMHGTPDSRDRRLLWRVRLTGAFTPKTAKIYQQLDNPMPPGSRVEAVCRFGHESTWKVAELRSRLL